jgi:hypothetical protein
LLGVTINILQNLYSDLLAEVKTSVKITKGPACYFTVKVQGLNFSDRYMRTISIGRLDLMDGIT